MLNRGFKEQIYDVYRYLPPATQVHLITLLLFLIRTQGRFGFGYTTPRDPRNDPQVYV